VFDVVQTIANYGGSRYGFEDVSPGSNFPVSVACSRGGLEFLKKYFEEELNIGLDVKEGSQLALEEFYLLWRPSPEQLRLFAFNQEIPSTEFCRQLSEYSQRVWGSFLVMEQRIGFMHDDLKKEGLADKFEEHKSFAEQVVAQQQVLIADLEAVMNHVFEAEKVLVFPFSANGYLMCSEDEFYNLLKRSEQSVLSYYI